MTSNQGHNRSVMAHNVTQDNSVEHEGENVLDLVKYQQNTHRDQIRKRNGLSSNIMTSQKSKKNKYGSQSEHSQGSETTIIHKGSNYSSLGGT